MENPKFCFECQGTGWHDVDMDGSEDVRGNTTEYFSCKSCNKDEQIPLYYSLYFEGKGKSNQIEEKYFKRQFGKGIEISGEQYHKWLDDFYQEVIKKHYS